MTVVSDAGPLIALARIGALNLLPGVYGDIVIPVAVRDEIRKPDRKRSGTVSFANADWLRTESVSDQSTRRLLHDNLDAGEREAIALAIELEAGVLLIDEALGRRGADSHGRTSTGTLGALLLAKEEDLIEAVAPVVDRLVSMVFRIGDALYQSILEQAGES
jgi:predicted nucleic acid-binding protein